MIKTDGERFAKALMAAGEVYGRDISKMVIQLYWKCLDEYDIDEVESAVQRHLLDPDKGQFFPKPADLIEKISGGSAGRALGAWSKVERAISSVGHYATVAFDDPVIHYCIDQMGGWIALASLQDASELPFKRIEFEKRYRHAMTRETLEYPATLIGYTEACNASSGYRHRDPVKLIGDREKASEVVKLGSDQRSSGFKVTRLMGTDAGVQKQDSGFKQLISSIPKQQVQ